MNMKNKLMSIQWKIFFYLLGFCGFLLLILWLFQVVFLDSFYKNIKINQIKHSAATIVKNIDNQNLQELIDKIASNNDLCIEILSESGDTLYSADVLRDCMIHKMDAFEKLKILNDAQDNGGEFLQYFSRNAFRGFLRGNNKPFGKFPPPESNQPKTMIYSKVIQDNAGNIDILLMNSVVSPVDATITTLRYQLYFITAMMIIISIFLAYLIARRVSKPIEKINESAKIMSTGNYDVEFYNKGYLEINELSDTLNATAKELSKVENLRRELIANISHDLRTPLTLISGYAEAMRDLPNENNAENASIIVEETKRLSTLVNDVLDISKYQSGTQEMNYTQYSLTTSLKNAVDRLNELIKKEGYMIEWIASESIDITADEPKISQAFYNLLTNAIHYTGQDKRIIVRQIATPNSVKIEVSDTGDGISEENLPLIWERYYKIDKTHKRAITGTGLGLSIVKQIIQMHGGRYGVSSKLGEGSTFWFELRR